MAETTIFSMESIEKQKEWVVEMDQMMDEKRMWASNFKTLIGVMKMKRTVKRGDAEKNVRISIFKVPEWLKSGKPEAFTPSLIGLGPYHHLDQNLYEMEDTKLEAAQQISKELGLPEFHVIRHRLTWIKLLGAIRWSYRGGSRGSSTFDDDTLATLMAVDGLFLIYIMSFYQKQFYEPDPRVRLQLEDSYGRKVLTEMVVRDVLMLENQIPLCVLTDIFTVAQAMTLESGSDPNFNPYSIPNADPMAVPDLRLIQLLVSFCTLTSPVGNLKWPEEWSWEVKNDKDTDDDSVIKIIPVHVLDILLQAITYRKDLREAESKCRDGPCGYFGDIGQAPLSSEEVQKCIDSSNTFMNGINTLFINLKPLTDIISSIPQHIGSILGIHFNDLFQEKTVLIPSVSKLKAVGVKFRHVEDSGGTRFISFDDKHTTLYLPVMVLRHSSEVVMRNLVAYEALEKTQSLSFRRFTELMGAMLDTTEDVMLLKQSEVLDSKLMEAEILEMFDGMVQTMESKDPIIDEAIRKTNEYYESTKKVRASRLMKKYVYSSWKFFTILFALLLLSLVALQTICQLYTCRPILRTTNKL